ncbi:MAG: hypothetical protein KC420_19430, partial [Myxococcales bacterium]|nr:hypothetical protein [Myxococcales bacterium]
PETGRAVLERVCKELADCATVIQVAQMEGNRMNMVLAPKARRDAPSPRPARARGQENAPIQAHGDRGEAPEHDEDDDDDDLDDDDLDDDEDDDDDDDDASDAAEASAD